MRPKFRPQVVLLFTLPALSMTALELPDTGAPTAVVYAEPQHAAALPPQPLAGF